MDTNSSEISPEALTLHLREKVRRAYASGSTEAMIQPIIQSYLRISPHDEDKLARLLALTLVRISSSNYACLPPLCLAAFARGINLFEYEISVEYDEYDTRRRRFPKYLSALVSFTTKPKSQNELGQLEQRWLECRCNIADRVIYQCHIEPPPGASTLANAASRVFFILGRTLAEVTPENGRIWPRSPSQVIVVDASEAILAAKQWLKIVKAPSRIYTCIAEQVRVNHSVRLTAFQDRELLRDAVRHLIMAGHRDGLVRQSGPEGPIAYDEDFQLERFFKSVHGIIRFHLHVLRSCDLDEYRRLYLALLTMMQQAMGNLIVVFKAHLYEIDEYVDSKVLMADFGELAELIGHACGR